MGVVTLFSLTHPTPLSLSLSLSLRLSAFGVNLKAGQFKEKRINATGLVIEHCASTHGAWAGLGT